MQQQVPGAHNIQLHTILHQAVSASGGSSQARRQRELYVGNLSPGVVTESVLRELFNGALAHLVVDPINNPPVISSRVDATGRFGFVELQTEELAAAALSLDKIEVLGKCLNVGRPKGYMDPPTGPMTARLSIANLMSKMLIDQPACTLLLENMASAVTLMDEHERNEVRYACCFHAIPVLYPIHHTILSSSRLTWKRRLATLAQWRAPWCSSHPPL